MSTARSSSSAAEANDTEAPNRLSVEFVQALHRRMCVGGTWEVSAESNPLLWLYIQWLQDKATEVRFVALPTGPDRWNRVIAFLERESEGRLTYTYLTGFLAAWRSARGSQSRPQVSQDTPPSYVLGCHDGYSANAEVIRLAGWCPCCTKGATP